MKHKTIRMGERGEVDLFTILVITAISVICITFLIAIWSIPPDRYLEKEGIVIDVEYIGQWGPDATVLTFADGQVLRFDSEITDITLGKCYRISYVAKAATGGTEILYLKAIEPC